MNLVELSKTLPVTHSSTFDQEQVSGNSTYVCDEHAAFAILINREVNLLGGIAVAHIVSPMAMTVLTSASQSEFSRLSSSVTDPMEGGTYVGTLNGIPVFIDPESGEEVPLRTIAIDQNGDFQVSEVGLKNISFI